MAYRGSAKPGEPQQLRYEITNEISRDAPEIAKGVFGNTARHPDISTVSNAEIDALYRGAYERNDRKFLMDEAQRDPQQFLDVTDRLGIPDPPLGMDGKPSGPPPDALQKAVQNAATPQALPPGAAPGAALGSVAPPAPAALPPAAAMPGPVSSQPPLPGF